MKTILYAMAVFTILISCADANKNQVAKVAADVVESMDIKEPESLLRHVVLFKFKEDASVEAVKKIEDAFSALPDQIDAIHDYEWGVNNSPEGLSKGLTHCFFVTFASEEDRQAYLPHPDHQAFVKLLEPVLDDVTVVDYWTK